MVIDDEPSIRTVFSSALTFGGYATSEAQSAEEAIAILASGVRPAAFFLDLRMPGMGGLGFLLHLRAQTEGADAPVAVITGDSSLDATTRAAVEALGGIVCFKPLQMDDVLRVARRLLRRRKAPRKVAARRRP
jgi:two-component system OmpR family response regulator